MPFPTEGKKILASTTTLTSVVISVIIAEGIENSVKCYNWMMICCDDVVGRQSLSYLQWL